MQDEETAYSRPATPDSPLASSLYHATSTIDELTLALTNFSRVPSPEPQAILCCCCGKEDCENIKNWHAIKTKLESRLILSAEVGQALLQRHEAYSGHHTPRNKSEGSVDGRAYTPPIDSRVAELNKENALLEKRLTQALLNNEVSEASNKTVLHELEEARSAVSRLTAHHARAVGLDSRLTSVLQEKDDIQQERDSQTQRAKIAESRLVGLRDRASQLQAEVRRLQEELEQRRFQRMESSESLLQDARSRLEALQQSVGKTAIADDSEVMQVLESLVSDNEILKRDNEELQQLLTESREDAHVLQTEIEEHRVTLPPPIRVETPHSRQSRSGPSSFIKDSILSPSRRQGSMEPKSRRAFEPLTPETDRRPLSPADSLIASETKYTSFIHPQPRYPPSHLSFDLENELDNSFPPTQSRGVQTDRWLGILSNPQLTPSSFDHISSSPNDGRSESSSLTDGHGSPLSSLLERVVSLLHRLSQADALTLTNRLKRQHLRGADVRHLSRSTVGNILSEVNHLRTQYRMLLEDEKTIVMCTRKDLRGLFKFFRDVFEELGQTRVTLNDVILDPSIATKVSEAALDPVKAEAMERERRSNNHTLASAWMAPLSKLFGTSYETPPPNRNPSPRPVSRGRGSVRPPRPVPKLGPALSASTTTVNVEFSGTVVGRSVTSTSSVYPNAGEGSAGRLPDSQPSSSSMGTSRSVMGIFAGAPHVEPDPWVVLGRSPRRVQSSFLKAGSGTATIGRSMTRNRHTNQLSRAVDAVVDANSPILHEEEDDVPGPLLERTLRRRGLSDSSIHSTFMSHSEDAPSTPLHDRSPSNEPWPERGSSVFQTLSRTMNNFRIAASHTISNAASPAAASSPSSTSQVSGQKGSSEVVNIPRPRPPRASSPAFSSFIPNLTSWAAAGAALEPHAHGQPGHVGSLHDDSMIHRNWTRDAMSREC
ncbi:hypothetical protein SERLA73DRAFT_71392 [Serpula lacrymans var. lacrymans S7.3]|uniref:Uncharacterized protein n=2 Tax=Serpula lacrymans var. lacrymans TaxID=341189 RepID=F8PQK2_SERL3|nr:uncharacterized protein SERLADRAFT_435744 [Serpula lacrymans var. lacrymans S7.9]EGO02250.1 hypothetical protein SERLA73DRAFT_71392 [Serpula lacrymans var. lacrymans S7.3]EGO27970.1 hypothetical protein SERLADRAFT_435744 [Serpula lacrymans var. lacrymans S7.9]